MMAHTVDPYLDLKNKVEFLRNIYATSGFGIRPKTQLSRIEMAKQVLAAVAGISPEQILIQDAQTHPHRTYATPLAREEDQYRLLMNGIREAVKKDLIRSV